MKAQTDLVYIHLLWLKIFILFSSSKKPSLASFHPLKECSSSVILSANYPLPGGGHPSSKVLRVTGLEYLFYEESNSRLLHSKFQRLWISLLSKYMRICYPSLMNKFEVEEWRQILSFVLGLYTIEVSHLYLVHILYYWRCSRLVTVCWNPQLWKKKKVFFSLYRIQQT